MAAVCDEKSELGSEAFELRFPVSEKRGGDDEERGDDFFSRSEIKRGEKSDGLKGLPEAHVIGETGSETKLVEQAQPSDSFMLIGTELGLDPFGRIDALFVGVANLS